jgi:hypothetical protein
MLPLSPSPPLTPFLHPTPPTTTHPSSTPHHPPPTPQVREARRKQHARSSRHHANGDYSASSSGGSSSGGSSSGGSSSRLECYERGGGRGRRVARVKEEAPGYRDKYMQGYRVKEEGDGVTEEGYRDKVTHGDRHCKASSERTSSTSLPNLVDSNHDAHEAATLWAEKGKRSGEADRSGQSSLHGVHSPLHTGRGSLHGVHSPVHSGHDSVRSVHSPVHNGHGSMHGGRGSVHSVHSPVHIGHSNRRVETMTRTFTSSLHKNVGQHRHTSSRAFPSTLGKGRLEAATKRGSPRSGLLIDRTINRTSPRSDPVQLARSRSNPAQSRSNPARSKSNPARSKSDPARSKSNRQVVGQQNDAAAPKLSSRPTRTRASAPALHLPQIPGASRSPRTNGGGGKPRLCGAAR